MPVTRRKSSASPAEGPSGPPQVLPDGFPNPAALNVWEYMAALSSDQWNEHIGYLYRINPSLAADAKPRYLDKFTSAITEESIKERYGGRGFKLLLKRGKDAVFDVYVNIEAEPKLQSGERLAAPPALASAAADPLVTRLVDDAIEQRNIALAGARSFDMNQPLRTALELQAKGFEAALAARSESPTEALLRPVLLKMLERVFEPAPAAADPLDQLVNTLERVKAVMPVAATSGGGEEPWAAVVCTVLPKLADAGVRMMEIYREAQLVRAGAPPVQTAVPLPPPPVVPALEANMKAALVRMLYSGDEGSDAALVLDKMDPVFAERLAGTLRSNPAELATDPILGALAAHPNTPQFAHDFLEYFEEPEEPSQAKEKSLH